MINRLLLSIFIVFCLNMNVTVFAETSKQIPTELGQNIYDSMNNNRNWPALHYALFNNHFEAAEWLLNNYSDTVQLKTPDVKIKVLFCPSSDIRLCYHYDYGFEDGFSALELSLMKDQPALAIKILHSISENDINIRRKELEGPYIDSWTKELSIGGYSYYTIDEWVKEINRFPLKLRTTTPLYWAILASNSEPLEILLEKNVDLTQTYSETSTNPTIMKIQIPNSIHVDAIETAAAWGSDDVLKKIIAHKLARSNTSISIENISDEVVRVFRIYGKNPQEGTLLFQAMQANDVEGFETLLAYGANPENKNAQTSKTLFGTALEHSNSEFVDILIAQFPSQLYLKDAILYDRIDVLNNLLEKGLGDCTDLYAAIKANKYDAATLLIEAGLLDQKAVEMIIEKDISELFEQFVNKYSMSGLTEKIIENNAIKIAAILLKNENQFTEKDLYKCVESGRLEILKLYSQHFSLSEELIENLALVAIQHKQKEIFDFFLALINDKSTSK